jgi:phosphate transport system substrate-binding protein
MRVTIALGLVTSLLLAACGANTGSSPSGSGASAAGAAPVSGKLTISGSSTVEPITSIVAEDFKAANPGVDYKVDGPGTGDGFALFCKGETDISDASRKIKDEEAAACKAAGINYVELKVGIDGISVITAQGNSGVTCLSFLDLYALLGPESKGFNKWSDANSLAAELAGSVDKATYGESHAPYPDASLDVTAPGEESGTFDTFVEFVIAKLGAERKVDKPTTRPDYTASANDNVIIGGIAGSPSSLGWVGFAFADENKGCVAPDAETIASGEYPMSRPLFIYVNTDKMKTNPAIKAFVDYYLSDTGIASVTEADYIALKSDELEKTRAAWTAAAG